jgi:cobalamin biosynthesis protein CobW
VSEEAVVVVVNADQLHEGLEVEGLFAEQLESADLVVLNKVDLVPVGALPGLEAAIEALHPGVPVVHATYGDVDPRLLLAADVRAGRGGAGPHDHAAHAHLHQDFVSSEVTIPAGLSADEVLARVEALGGLRVKGFVRTSEGIAVVQGVGRRIEVQPADGPVRPDLLGRVVVIRRGAAPRDSTGSLETP